MYPESLFKVLNNNLSLLNRYLGIIETLIATKMLLLVAHRLNTSKNSITLVLLKNKVLCLRRAIAVMGERGLTNEYAFTYCTEEERYKKELSRGPSFYSCYLYKRLDL